MFEVWRGGKLTQERLLVQSQVCPPPRPMPPWPRAVSGPRPSLPGVYVTSRPPVGCLSRACPPPPNPQLGNWLKEGGVTPYCVSTAPSTEPVQGRTSLPRFRPSSVSSTGLGALKEPVSVSVCIRLQSPVAFLLCLISSRAGFVEAPLAGLSGRGAPIVRSAPGRGLLRSRSPQPSPLDPRRLQPRTDGC